MGENSSSLSMTEDSIPQLAIFIMRSENKNQKFLISQPQEKEASYIDLKYSVCTGILEIIRYTPHIQNLLVSSH